MIYKQIDVLNMNECNDVKKSYTHLCEMTKFERNFLCSLLKEKKPKKILEVGVAAGATTALVLEFLSELDVEVEYYSCDLFEEYYSDSSKKTGFIIEEIKKNLSDKIKHYLFTGHYLPEYLGDIGGSIDFVIIDTVHVLPGEMLDFLAVFPFLTNNATVVLHDTSLNYYSYNQYAYATKVIFDVIDADKYMVKDEARLFKIPNIMAFDLNEYSKKSIRDLFSSLSLTWDYVPDVKELDIYRTWYRKYYSEELLELYDNCVLGQKYLACKRYKKNEFDECIRKCMAAKSVYIYGYGTIGRMFADILKVFEVSVKAFIVSEVFTCQGEGSINIICEKECKLDKEDIIVMTIRNKESCSKITERLALQYIALV